MSSSLSSPIAPGQPLLQLRDIRKVYTLGGQQLTVLGGVSLDIAAGEFVAIMGQSGSGKSTLMNIIGMLDTPTSGSYSFAGQDVSGFNETQLTTVRREQIGFVFQQYNLLPRMSALQQVVLPLQYRGLPRAQRPQLALDALHTVGLQGREGNKPTELSGGQQQRVSIARAIVGHPGIILADEPTGALDSKTGHDVMELFAQLHRQGRTVIIITHAPEIAAYAQRIIRISDGQIVS